jgi:hypothetical protein
MSIKLMGKQGLGYGLIGTQGVRTLNHLRENFFTFFLVWLSYVAQQRSVCYIAWNVLSYLLPSKLCVGTGRL